VLPAPPDTSIGAVVLTPEYETMPPAAAAETLRFQV
jgi:hypothetical protein